MPIFDFHCNKCCKDFEVLVLGGEKTQCPVCSGCDLTKKISTFATHIKGGTPTQSKSSCSGCKSRNCSSCG